MGTFWCDDNHQQHQQICGCHPPMWDNPDYWLNLGVLLNGCYAHYTGQSC